MSLRKAILAGAMVLGATALGAGTALASPGPVHHPAPPHINHAYAAVELLGSGNEQWASVVAQAPGYPKGFVDYTNFNAPARSRVWSLNTGAAEELKVWANGHEYDHTLNAGEVLKALSDDEVSFTGTGYYNPVPANDTWTVAGDIHGNNVTFTITYGPWAVPTYTASFQGRIAWDGSAKGTFKDVNNVTGTWALPRGTFETVLHYTAPIFRDSITADRRHHSADANVVFKIPFGNPYAGTVVDWNFGTRFGNKFWAQGVNGGTLSPETVEAGVIVIS